ncbi:MAG: TatD family hydrolase [Acidimicrobiia bacterium]|nr:TatD family hydrolase [Acidimicrobiia bacterium]
MWWTDSHCHVQWCEGGAEAAIERARAAGVVGMVVVGTDGESSLAAIDLASRHDDLRATVGLHPHDASKLDAEWPRILELARAPGVVAIGEAGFDLHYRHSEPDVQEAAFRAQIRLAKELDRALVIHSREAWDDTLRVLTDEGPPPRTVFHCFTGGPAEAGACLDLGAHLSFSGIVSFKGADDVRAAAATCPLDRLLVETDAPYLAPAPHRGRENEPALVSVVGAALAAAAGFRVEEVAAATVANAARVLETPLDQGLA